MAQTGPKCDQLHPPPPREGVSFPTTTSQSVSAPTHIQGKLFLWLPSLLSPATHAVPAWPGLAFQVLPEKAQPVDLPNTRFTSVTEHKKAQESQPGLSPWALLEAGALWGRQKTPKYKHHGHISINNTELFSTILRSFREKVTLGDVSLQSERAARSQLTLPATRIQPHSKSCRTWINKLLIRSSSEDWEVEGAGLQLKPKTNCIR